MSKTLMCGGGRAGQSRRLAAICMAAALFAAPSIVRAQEPSAEQATAGARVYSRNCSPCHGVRMRDPEGAFDLRKFPHDNKDRFVTSVTNGKGQMPSWNGLLTREEIDQVWAYVVTGEK